MGRRPGQVKRLEEFGEGGVRASALAAWRTALEIFKWALTGSGRERAGAAPGWGPQRRGGPHLLVRPGRAAQPQLHLLKNNLPFNSTPHTGGHLGDFSGLLHSQFQCLMVKYLQSHSHAHKVLRRLLASAGAPTKS